MAHLNDLPSNSIADSRLFIPAALPDAKERAALSFLGPIKPDDVNSAIARGDINPMTHKPFRVERVGDVVHVTSGDINPAAQLPFAPAPRRTAPASLEPKVPHVGLSGHRKPSLGQSQPGMLPCISNVHRMLEVVYNQPLGGRIRATARCSSVDASAETCCDMLWYCVQAQVLHVPQEQQPSRAFLPLVAAPVHLLLCSAATCLLYTSPSPRD